MEEREFAILSVCREKDATYEWVSHVGTRKAGMRDEAVEVMRNGAPTDGLKDDERDMINYTRELLRQNRVTDQTFDSLLKRHGERLAGRVHGDDRAVPVHRRDQQRLRDGAARERRHAARALADRDQGVVNRAKR